MCVCVCASLSHRPLSSSSSANDCDVPPQIPYLAEGVRIHGEKVSEALRPFHDRLEGCFRLLREKVEKQYGAKTLVRPRSTEP